MENRFNELSKSLAEGVSRWEALRKFGFALVGVLLVLQRRFPPKRWTAGYTRRLFTRTPLTRAGREPASAGFL